MDHYVLCRRDIGPIGEKRYCAKPIKKKNNMDWCETCLSRLPFWPKGGSK